MECRAAKCVQDCFGARCSVRSKYENEMRETARETENQTSIEKTANRMTAGDFSVSGFVSFAIQSV